MRLFALTMLIVSSLAFAGVPVNEVDHVVATPTVHIVPTTIKGMPIVDEIYDAGNTSWAVNHKQNLVAFYDGTAWQPATSVPGFKSIDTLTPAYPVTGKKPEAWALSQNLLSHFDGIHWSAPLNIVKILKLRPLHYDHYEYHICASNGYLFLISESVSSYEIHFSIYNPLSDSWSAPQILSSLSDGILFFNAYNAINPHAVVNFADKNGDFNLAVINQDASYYTRSGLDQGVDIISLYDRDYYYSSAFLYYTDIDNQNVWHSVPVPIFFKDRDLFSISSRNVSSDVVCSTDVDDSSEEKKSALLKMSCINIQDAEPQWTPIITLDVSRYVTSGGIAYDVTARNDGAWIVINEGYYGYLQDIYSYDMATQDVINTNFRTETHIVNSQKMRTHALTQSALVACLSPRKDAPSQKISLFVYDLKMKEPKWTEVDTSASNIQNCSFSQLYNYQEQTGNFWIIGSAKQKRENKHHNKHALSHLH